MLGSLSVSCRDNVQLLEKAQTALAVHSQSDGRQHVEVRAVSVIRRS
ncbi:unnamed protein product [Musa acuminata subsp. malaccensis]|uniref:(wild Malaysian banana) hypothetical protein n=1 Tax=Musa acuminata subsp. malaccensis TaxID=214687 RepID=A0A804HYT7_MUSAM|nr:unnamed protein product [Musa acuminata subsp. malaccensis]